MKTLLQTAALAAMLAFTTVAVAGNPVVGTWELDVAKSKFSPGPAPKSDTRTYTESADGMTMTWTSTAADGKVMNVKSTFKADGKDYPLTGSPNFDTLTLKQVDGNTVHSIQKQGREGGRRDHPDRFKGRQGTDAGQQRHRGRRGRVRQRDGLRQEIAESGRTPAIMHRRRTAR